MVAVKLDPWDNIIGVHWPNVREAIYLTTSAIWTPFPSAVFPPEQAMAPGGPYGSDFPNFRPYWTDSISMMCLRDEVFYHGPPTLYDADGHFIASAETSTFTINKPGNTVTKSWGPGEVLNRDALAINVLTENVPTGASVPLFPSYIAGPGRFLAIGLIGTGSSMLLDTDLPNDGFGRVLYEFPTPFTTINTFILQPSSVTYKGHAYFPIGAAYQIGDQFSPDFAFRYPALVIDVLFKK